jgi:photosystem II stability/assembly factor-like uncharacterized protein
MYGFLKIVFLSITIGSVNLFSQWYKVNAPEFYYPISLDAYDDKNCIFSTTTERALYITKDGGITWHKIVNINGAGDSEISDVSMVNPYKIYLAAANGKIIVTSNGGESWNIQFEDSTRTNCISYIEMFDENNGVAFGDAIELASALKIFFVNSNLGWAIGSFILKTTDGGETWIEQPRPSPDFYARNIFFLNESVGWIHDNSFLRKTTDGGNSWNLAGGIGSANTMLIFFDENNGYRLSSGVMKTTDGGISWTNKTSRLEFNIFGMNFIDKDTGWVIGDPSRKHTLFGTVNGGNEWSVIKTFDTETPRRIFFTNKNNGYSYYSKTISSSDFRSYFLRTTDGGKNWSSTVFENEFIRQLQVFKGAISDTVIIFQDNKLLRSTDNGTTWELNLFEEFESIGKNFLMINSNVGFSFSHNRSIYKTSNSGKSWILKYQVVPTSAVILNTTNGGQNWNYVENNNMIGWGTVDYSRRIDFVDINTGYFKPAITYNPPPQTIFKTTNGGLTWESTGLINPIYALKFYNADFGMAAGFTYNVVNNETKGCIFITKDGGATFDTVLVGNTGGINSIEFHKSDPAKVWCSNVDGLFYSADSGKSWKEQSFLFSPKPQFRHIKFVDNSVGWIAANGFILRTTNAGGVFTSVENEIIIPNNFQLYQNYPNPFNPATTIKYSIPAETTQRSVFTTLKIYDLLGSEVASLVNEIKSPGNYEVKFNAGKLPSGIYFYTLKTGSSSLSRKMVVLK